MKFFVLIAFYLSVVTALPLDVLQDKDGQKYVILPLQRERRAAGSYSLGAKGNVFNSNNHKVDGSIGGSWGSHGLKPDTFGGRVDYSHKPSGSGAFVGANRTPGWGTDVSAGGKYNIAGGKNWGADVSSKWGKHYGGPGGTGKSGYGVGLNVNGKF